jgi:exonuclease III
MKVVSWNCRGLGSKQKVEAMKYLMRISSPDVLLVQETKLEEQQFFQTRKSFWNSGEGVAVSSRGASGGLGTLWNPSKFDLIQSFTCTHWIFTNLCHKDTGLQVSLFNIYVPVLLAEKRDCWKLIQDFLHLHHPENLILAGDLNLTLSSQEKKGGTPVRDPLRKQLMI